jgi:hypothetical protein
MKNAVFWDVALCRSTWSHILEDDILDEFGLAQGPMVESCECGKAPSVSIKVDKLL